MNIVSKNNMKKSISFLTAFLFVCAAVLAQDSTKAPVKSTTMDPNDNHGNYVDLGVSGISDQFAVSLSWSHLIGIGKGQKRFKMGYGIRYTSYFGKNQNYTTAPAKYANTPADVDTLLVGSPQLNACNATIHLQYSITKKFDLGFNIDAIGFSFGWKRDATVISSSYDPGQPSLVYVRPVAFNLLLVGNNDKGTLNSEFYARYWVTPRFAIKAAYTYLFTDYRTYIELSFNTGAIENTRYRLKSGLATIAVSWRPFIK
jgi:hypothetical protein